MKSIKLKHGALKYTVLFPYVFMHVHTVQVYDCAQPCIPTCTISGLVSWPGAELVGN